MDKLIERWKLGVNKDESNSLFYLVKSGEKTATSYLYDENFVEPNEYSILLNWDESEEISLKTLNFTIVSFKDVTEVHAYKEGEGDRTLDYWREVHKDFFAKRLMSQGKTFSDNVLIVCEEFKRV